MAFNLNKNDGLEQTGNSKFDLSKKGIPAATASGTRKSNNLRYIGVGILLVSIVGWYFLSNNDEPSRDASLVAPAEVVVDSLQIQAAKADGDVSKAAIAEGNSIGSDGVESITSLNNKVPASFANGSTTFDKVDQSIVDELLSVLAANPGSSVEVLGYASSEGTLAANQSISQARANAFKDYLVSKNVSASRITAIGKGIEDPIASNQTEVGRKKNRRVEVKLK